MILIARGKHGSFVVLQDEISTVGFDALAAVSPPLQEVRQYYRRARPPPNAPQLDRIARDPIALYNLWAEARVRVDDGRTGLHVLQFDEPPLTQVRQVRQQRVDNVPRIVFDGDETSCDKLIAACGSINNTFLEAVFKSRA